MKAGLAQKEPLLLTKWEKEGLHQRLRAKSKGKKYFTLHDGPPYANGHIHIGHALNKVLKDMIVKMKSMQGFDSLYIPGWDCHGLPIEHQLFKDLKKKKSEVEPLEFRKKAHEYAIKFVGIQREEFKRLGILGQWENPYLTLSSEYEYWILNSLARLTEKSYVYRGLKPVNWCASCETALAEAEVEYEDHSSPSVYVKFRVANPDTLFKISGGRFQKPISLLIWTTTPWTLLANVAVAVHPSYEYALVDVGEEILIIEKSLVSRVVEKRTGAQGKILHEVAGDDLKGLRYEHPFGVKTNCCVINVDYVTREDGTGLVHTAPGHGQEDFQAGVAHNLEVLVPVNDRGVFTQEAGSFAGQHVFKANENIIQDLNSRGILWAAEKIAHSYPHCWRCKNPVIFRATKQWFLKVDHENLRGRLKKAIKEEVQWIPPMGQERILGMVLTRPDWCLSRQRHWGVPIPAVSCEGCGDEHKLFPEVIEHFAQMVKKEGTDAWFARDVKDLIPAGWKCPDCGQANFKKTYDILDVWFDSGVSHQAVVKPMLGRDIPVEMYLEGSDQHRGWFQSSLIPGVALENKPPFSSVLTHGFVVDGQGRKMSKSLGNVISPQEVIQHHGADVLRLWVASSDYHEDIRLSEEILSRVTDAYRKIRNTLRFLLGNLHGYDPDQHALPYQELLEIDRWALYHLFNTMTAARDEYNRYEFVKVYHRLYRFCNEDLSQLYLDILKDRLYTSATLSKERRSAQTVLFHILDQLVRVLAPILSFTAAETYEFMPKTSAMKTVENVHLLEWEPLPQEWNQAKSYEHLKTLLELRPFVLKALEDERRARKIGSSLEAKVVLKLAGGREKEYFHRWQDILPSVFIVSEVLTEVVDQVAAIGDVFPYIEVKIEKAAGEKCGRCWNYRIDVGQDHQHPSLCGRCCKAVREVVLQ
ncbi:MAG: isoleucine--tRNA ligase [Candidatus Omnitrophica bacterium]|nr:isoleucine--tRNA ligase [Candidatus Omnitrophota bacterium]